MGITYVIAPKKNGQLRVCVNPKKVNAITISRDNYPLLICFGKGS